MVNSEQEAQQLQFVVMMPLILSIVVIINIFQHPSSSLAFWVRFFLHCAIGDVYPHRFGNAADVADRAFHRLMLATIYAMVLLCSRIYRIGILMYGKSDAAGNYEVDTLRIKESSKTQGGE